MVKLGSAKGTICFSSKNRREIPPLRMPTRSQEANGQKESACFGRNDGWLPKDWLIDRAGWTLEGEEIFEELLAGFGQDGFGVELYAFEFVAAVADAHDDAVVGLGSDG